MAKEKKRVEVEKSNPYIYEIASTIIILLGLITFSELGVVGTGAKSLLKILFGDFYFIFLLFLVGQGIYTLVKHTWIDFTSIKINGFILFYISLISLNHFAFYELLGIESTEILKQTFNTYSSVIKGNLVVTSYGGGLIGALGLQLLIYLFNRLGTIVILIVLIILSISFMTNLSYKNTFYYITFIYKKIRNFVCLIFKYFSNIKPPQRRKISKNFGVVNLNLLNDCDNKANEAISYKVAFEEKNQLVSYFINQGFNISSSKVDVGYNASKYTFLGIIKNVNEIQIANLLHSKIIVKYNNNFLEIECINKIKRLLTLKYLLLLDKPYLPIGCDFEMKVYSYDFNVNKNILVVGAYDSGLRTFIKSFIVSNIFLYKENFKIVVFDYKNEFSELKFFPNLYLNYQNKHENFMYSIDELAVELERRIQILNDNNYENFTQFNFNNTDKIFPIYVFINSIENLKDANKNYESKLLYFLKFGHKAGIIFICSNRNIGVSKSVISAFATKIIYKCHSMDHSYEITGSKNACNLDKKGDAIYLVDNKASRISTPYISNGDYERVINKFVI